MCFTEPPDEELAVEPCPPASASPSDELAVEPQLRRLSLSSHERERHQPEGRAELARHRRMRLTLLDLQRTMDPLIAAHAYNNKHSPLARLPDEILLPIVAFCLGNDLIDVYCLRRVSARFRRIVYEPEIGRRVLDPPWPGSWSYSERRWDLSLQQRQELRHRLQRDGMCDMCLDRRDFPVDGSRLWSSPGRGPADALRTPPWSRCRFSSESRAMLHCDGCGTHHDAKAFRPRDFCSEKGRLCLGRRGGVRMCEHVVISWEDIETHIRSRRKESQGESWQACLESFGVECRDPSHDRRCTAEQAATWPRASLGTSGPGGALVLTLEWKPHSGLGALSITPDGRIPASELRALFRGYREGPAGMLVPSRPSLNHLPEMTCFYRTACDCVHYEGAGQPARAEMSRREGPLSITRLVPCLCTYSRGYHRHRGLDAWIETSRHAVVGDAVCLVTAYRYSIEVCDRVDDRINPSHDWFHAMDPGTYDFSHSGFTSPRCRDRGCMDYSQRPGSCPHWVTHGPTHSPCSCPSTCLDR